MSHTVNRPGMSPFASRRLTRRRVLASGLGLGGLALAAGLPLGTPRATLAASAAPQLLAGGTAAAITFSEWSQQARLADASFGAAPDDAELLQLVATLKAQNVSVVEVDTELSNWCDDLKFAAMMADARRFNDKVHAAGMRAVWYYPALETISVGGEAGPSLFKAHPDWVQRDITNQPNVFYGSLVFWVAPGDESAWLSPNGPWRQVYLDRVKLLAASGADGLWPDVPIYFNGAIQWCDFSPGARAAFAADTGLAAPTSVNWADPLWRRWIEWRHRNLAQWQRDIAAAGRSVNPDFLTFVETVTMDYYDATAIGLDGAYLRLDEGISQVWEVDVVSDDSAMRNAKEDDWIGLIAMYKYARAASGAKPAWAFSYGKQADDASLVMAEALAAGCNPYEVQSPGKTVSTDTVMRTRMYAYALANGDRLFGARSLAKVALYHSSASRDYVASQTVATGMYCTTTQPAGVTAWWSTDAAQSCYVKPWLSEYRGLVKMLVHAHVPFNILTSPTLRTEDLAGYRVLLLPDLQAVSDGEAALLRQFVQGGGTLVLTGMNPTGLNQFGDTRAEYALADVLGFGKAAPPPVSVEHGWGAGRVAYFRDLPGQNYLQTSAPTAFGNVINAVNHGAPPFVTLGADRRVHLEATQLGGEILLQFTNFVGVTGTFSTVPTSVAVTLTIPADRQVATVALTSPDNATPALQPLAHVVNGATLTFTVSLQQYALVAIGTTPAPLLPTYALTLTTGNGGTASVSPEGPYRAGTVVTLTAAPDTGYTFANWTVDGAPAGTANPLTLTMDGPHTVTAQFTLTNGVRHALALTAGPGGTASAAPDGPYDAGTVVTLTAQPASGNLFLGWTVDGQFRGWANPLTITMDADHHAAAAFGSRQTFRDATPAQTGATEAIAQLAARGIIKGYADGTFGPTDPTLRAQMAALIVRAMGWGSENPANPFPDRNDVDDELWRAIAILANHGVAKGYGDGSYGTTDPVLNAQVVSFITRAMVNKGYWRFQPDDGTIYPNVAAASGHRQDLVTYVHYAGAVRGAENLTGDFTGWEAASSRAYFAFALWQALNSYFSVDNVP